MNSTVKNFDCQLLLVYLILNDHRVISNLGVSLTHPNLASNIHSQKKKGGVLDLSVIQKFL